MVPWRVALCLYAAASGGLMTGCIRLTGEVLRESVAPGPFVTISSVAEDATVTIGDSGEPVHINGISTEGLSAAQLAALRTRLRDVLMGSRAIVVVARDQGRVTLEESHPHPVPPCQPVAITLFPKIVYLGSLRMDVASLVIGEGLARADRSATADPRRQQWWELAEEEARTKHKGIWAEPAAGGE